MPLARASRATSGGQSTVLPSVGTSVESTAALPFPLPSPLSSFVGRRWEIAEVRQLLSTCRLLTLLGPPGTGKTRLAIEVARETAGMFPDGVCFVPLAPIVDPQLVTPTIARALGVPDFGARPLLDSVKESLGEQHCLLVLDNFEQILAAGPMVVDILDACPGLQVLVTSRAVLQLSGEQTYLVPPLSLPDDQGPVLAADLATSEAVQLLVQRARSARADFALTDETAPAIAGICRRLDGLPLAIELAAARFRLLPPPMLLARLERCLELLTGGGRDLQSRQRTLRGAIAWSHGLLGPEDQALYRRLAVFVGGFELEAVEGALGHWATGSGLESTDSGQGPEPTIAVGQASAPSHLLDGLQALVEQSLLRQRVQPDGEPRFQMLETIREYALEQLMASGEEQALRRRHAEHYLQMAEAGESEWAGRHQIEWLRRLEREHDNFRAALRWSLAADPVLAARLCVSLGWFWYVHSHYHEGIRWLEAALLGGGCAPKLVRARLLMCLGVLTVGRAEFGRARSLLEESLALLREIGDREWTPGVLNMLGCTALYQGDLDRAAALLGDALAAAQVEGDPRLTALSLDHLGDVARLRADFERAERLYGEGLTLFRQVGDQRRIAVSVMNLAGIAVRSRELDRADELYREGLVLARAVQDQERIAEGLEGMASVSHARGRLSKAARLLGAAERLREVFCMPLAPVERDAHSLLLCALQRDLGTAAYAAGRAEGQAMTTEQAIDCALEGCESAAEMRTAGATRLLPREVTPLTPREGEVAVLIARGLSNRDIARELVITEGTAANHVEHIRGKLGFQSRTQVAVWAVERGLTAVPS